MIGGQYEDRAWGNNWPRLTQTCQTLNLLCRKIVCRGGTRPSALTLESFGLEDKRERHFKSEAVFKGDTFDAESDACIILCNFGMRDIS
jgi:hypothetical protein